MFTRLFIFLILFYQHCLSPLKPPSCRYYPSCSSYALEAITRYGVIVGIWKTLGRICRCHPLHPGGYDPVK